MVSMSPNVKPMIKVKASPTTVAPSPEPSPTSSDPVRLSVSKKYVLPPRPKPGRKPSADTPPNRRKAQNRDAQRAFRERRAAAIQDLESKLGEAARKHAEEQANLQATIDRLARENQRLRTVSTPPGDSVYSPGVASPLSGFSPVQSIALSPMAALTPPAPPVNDMAMEILDRALEQKLPVPSKGSQTVSPTSSNSSGVSPRSPATSKSTPPSVEGAELLASNWKSPAVPLRRRLSSLETDFTLRFKPVSRRMSNTLSPLKSSSSPIGTNGVSIRRVSQPGVTTDLDRQEEFYRHPDDRCGFCTDDTPCLCAETAARECGNLADIETLGDNTLPPLNIAFRAGSRRPSAGSSLGSPLPSIQVGLSQPSGFSPASSPKFSAFPNGLDDPAPRIQTSDSLDQESECTGDPGSCAQCQADPMSTLFCTTVANKVPNKLSLTGTFIPAQAAYRTLSRHKNFQAVDFGTVVGSLETRGTQVEVNSVAKVLRMLDSRLYS